jgi:signal transduction histidine kinase/DNA-binding response OmpR family regulator
LTDRGAPHLLLQTGNPGGSDAEEWRNGSLQIAGLVLERMDVDVFPSAIDANELTLDTCGAIFPRAHSGELMNQEVSCRTIQAIIQNLRERHQDVGVIYADVPYSHAHLSNKNERIGWDDFCTIVRNLKTIWSDADFESLGSRVIESASFYGSMTASRLFFNSPDLYIWVNRNSSGPGAQLFTCIHSTTTIVRPNHLSVTLSLLPDYQYCHEFFMITKGALTTTPTLIGLPPSRVAMREMDNGAIYEIDCPEGGGTIAWVRRALTWPRTFRIAVKELKDANESLHERFTELEAAREKVARQATQLKVAYDISRLIHSSLDLDSTLDAIAHSLVEVAGFAAAAITVDTATEGRRIERHAMAGNAFPGGITIARPLDGRGACIGEVTLSLASGMEIQHAGDLLDYVIPTIAMEIDDALSFTIVNDLRTTLERKVENRTRELKDMNAVLMQAQAGRDRLFANISHELRTPLTLILGPLEGMLEKSRRGSDRQRFSMMKKSADRLLYLINQMLELARLQSGDNALHALPSALVPFLRGITMSYRSLAATRRITLTFHGGTEPIGLLLDHDKAEMLFNNLLMNAFKFTPDGGKIEVRVRKRPPFVDITVSDSGVGIPKAELPRIFDRFYQGSASDRHPTGGTGIGLSLAREIVELHHGTIRVARSVVDRGTAFVVSLPIREDLTGTGSLPAGDEASKRVFPEDSRDLSPSQLPSAGTVKTRAKDRILVIDDDPDVRLYIRDILGGVAQMVEAGDGVEGIRLAQETVPDLVICDIMMPGRNGNEVCRTLKEDVRTSHIPVILLTARAGTESRIEGLETGADDFIVKPFVARELRTRVRNLIALRASLRKRFLGEGRLRTEVLQAPSKEQQFLHRAINIVDRHMADESFDIDAFSGEAGLSRAQLHRKLVALTTCSAGEFLRRLRLERASALLRANVGTVSEIAYQVGFTDPSHFARCFRHQFGVSPGSLRPAPLRTYQGKRHPGSPPRSK